MNYSNKVVLITGGSKGIGRGCVEAFVQAGAKVVFCARHAEEGEKLANEVSKGGPGTARFFQCDVSNVEEIKKLIDATIHEHNQLDCLINNAGWHPGHRPIDDFSIEE